MTRGFYSFVDGKETKEIARETGGTMFIEQAINEGLNQ